VLTILVLIAACHNLARKNFEQHNPKSQVIFGEVSEEEKKNIKLRKLVLKKIIN
jgi:hypothetical protein